MVLEHPFHVWYNSTHDSIYSRLYQALGRGREEGRLYVADLFDEKVMEYDPMRISTDVFYFDGASTVQKAGEVLMARFPCTFSFQGSEHVVSLFFSSIAKIRQVKVSHVFVLFSNKTFKNLSFFIFTGY